jgi:hypothetical protein
VVGLVNGNDNNPTVPDLACPRGCGKNPNEVVDFIVVGNDLDHHSGQELKSVVGASINNHSSLFMPASTRVA